MIYLCLAIAAVLVVNGAAMLIDPQAWYGAIPGVTDTGPLNVHFVRDIGCSYVVAGLGLLWRGVDPARGWPAAVAAAFLVAHAGVHLLEATAGDHVSTAPLVDVAAVYGPALLVAWLALPGARHYPADPAAPLKWLLGQRVRSFELAFGYDAGYMHEMLDTSLPAFLRFGLIEGLARHREDAPVEAWYAAKIAACIGADCGPCTQLVVDMALAEGVSPDLIRALAAGDVPSMTGDAALGYRFALASLAHDFQAGALREEIAARWGARAVLSLALTIAASRVFPTVKYAMGHGQACARIQVAGSDLVVAPRAHCADAAA